MAKPSGTPEQTNRIVFLTRDPVVHEQSGSTTYILGLLQLLRSQGAAVTLVATSAYSRSPRLFFRIVTPLPEGVQFRVPGYLRLGPFYVLPAQPKAWVRALARLAARRPWMNPLQQLCAAAFGNGLYTGPWDLTSPTPAECESAVREAESVRASTVIANYCIWGSLLGDRRFGKRRAAILMHDLLSVRAQRFVEAGTPLDMPLITEAEEMQWLAGADTILAAQEREAEIVRRHVAANVLVTPLVLQPRALDPSAIVPGRCLFVGSNIAPNRTGLEFLLEAVWPRVRAQVPGATLAVAGTVGLSIAAAGGATHLPSLGIEILGKVPSLEAEYARAAVCLVPLLLGTGIKIKLVEALAFGKAVVATSLGVEGLEAWAPEAVSIADHAGNFVAAIVQLLTDEDLRHRREAAALRLARQHFGPDQALDPAFLQAIL